MLTKVQWFPQLTDKDVTDDRSTLAALLTHRLQKKVFSSVTTKQLLLSQAVGFASVAVGTNPIDRRSTSHSTHRGAVVKDDSHTSHKTNHATPNTSISKKEASRHESQETGYTNTSEAHTFHATDQGTVSTRTHDTRTDGLSTLDMPQAMISERLRDNATLELKEADIVIMYSLKGSPGGTGSNSTMARGPGTCWLNFSVAPHQVC